VIHIGGRQGVVICSCHKGSDFSLHVIKGSAGVNITE
jgi:hypothetical protein